MEKVVSNAKGGKVESYSMMKNKTRRLTVGENGE